MGWHSSEDNVSLVLSNVHVPAQKYFSKYFFRCIVPDKLQDIIPRETSNNARAKSPKICLKWGCEDLNGWCSAGIAINDNLTAENDGIPP